MTEIGRLQPGVAVGRDAGGARWWPALAAVVLLVAALVAVWSQRADEDDAVTSGPGSTTAPAAVDSTSSSTTGVSTTTTTGAPVSEPVAAYEVVELGTLGGDDTEASDVNASAQVVGTSTTAASVPGDSHFQAFFWDPAIGRMVGLRAAGPASLDSTATAINDAGIVVGWSGSLDCTDPDQCRATRWDPATGEVDDLGTLAGESTAYDVGSRAFDINSSGQIVGQSTTSSGEHHAFLWDPTTRTMLDLGTLGGTYSDAHGINDRGEVTGYSGTRDGGTHAFVWTAETGMQELGPSASESYGIDPAAINESGTVVGSRSDGDVRNLGFVWWRDDRRFQDLGEVLPSDINDGGLIVGRRVIGNVSAYEPVAMSPSSGTLVQLPVWPGFPNGSASAVNGAGVIVGSVSTHDTSRALVWTPSTDEAP